ncbi:MAG: PilW family protein [Planctomycetota bacterium]
MRTRGFTLVEVVIAATIFLLLFGAAATAIVRDQRTHGVLAAHFGPEMRAQHALERIATELRMAGEWGEDRDHDGELDPGEDTNENGELDSAWDLEDGAANQDRISFNRRIDLRDAEGDLLASGIYSPRVSYRLEGTDLVREWDHTLPDGAMVTRRAVIAKGISGLRFDRSGVLVTVSLDVLLPKLIYEPGARRLRSRIWLRN